MRPSRFARAAVAAVLAAAFALPAGAQIRPQARPESLVPAAMTAAAPPAEAPAPAAAAAVEPEDHEAPLLGPETRLPLPRFVSLKSDEGNVRRGPSLSHRVDWVFRQRGMPLQITAEYGHWRRVIDREGLGGWVHYALLSGVRTVIVDQDMMALRARPEEGATEVALLEAGVIARIRECAADWCRLETGGFRGWAPKTALWGVGADEILE